jgi:regulation of enolase protein 1 (concanavalin A-like superfamily)
VAGYLLKREVDAMRRCAWLILVSFVVCATVSASAAAEKAPQTIKGFGTVVDPDDDCQVKEERGVVTIIVPKTHHDLTYTTDYTKLNSPRILQDAKGAFRIEVKIASYPLPKPMTSSGGRFSFVSSGLLIWRDERNFIRMDRAAEGSSKDSPFVWVERFEDGKSASQKFHPVNDRDTYLRVSRDGDKFTFETSDDGTTWTTVHSDEAKLAAELKVGVHAVNTTTDVFAPKIEGLKLTSGH